MIKNALFLLGIGLMALNLIGLVTPPRSSELINETATYFVNDLTLSEQEFYQRLEVLDPSHRADYLTQLSRLVSESVMHYWQDEHRAEYRILLPWSENFILRALAYVNPKYFAMYEFQDHRKAIARGVGLCSQHSIITAGFLAEQGIPAKLIELHGHVILTAEVDEGQWWLLDPDYGLVLPFSLQEAEENPAEVAQFYYRAGFSDYDVDKVEEFFRTDNNIIFDGGAESYQTWLFVIEKISYVAKWAIPVGLLLPVFLTKDKRIWLWTLRLWRSRNLIGQVTDKLARAKIKG
mgnify:CR=1 FL=1